MILVFQIIVFLFSVMVHEVSHGAVAYRLGDDTAEKMGRLNLNPLKHIDFFGSILLPLLLITSQSPIIFGWAKPVPYNPNNLKNPRLGSALIGLAGPLSNFTIAVIFGILVRALNNFAFFQNDPNGMILILFFKIIIMINLLLGVFNLVPIPPLDGSKLLLAALPPKLRHWELILETYGMWILLFFILFGFGLLRPIIGALYALIVGSPDF